MPTDADGTSNETKPINPRYLGGEGEKALERALKILEAQPPSAHDTLVATLIQTGDWYQIKHAARKSAALLSPRSRVERDARGSGDGDGSQLTRQQQQSPRR